MEVAGRPSEDQNVCISACDPCMYTGESVKSVSFCVNCIEYLCMNCLKYHKKTKTTRYHKTLEGNSVPSNKEAFERMQSITLCPVHVDQKIIYKCTNHSVYACLKCVRSDHLTCKSLVDITTLEETDSSSDIIQSHILKIKEKQNDAHKTVENIILRLNMEKDTVLGKRKQLMDKLKAFLVQLEQSSQNIKEIVKTECGRIQVETKPTLNKLGAFITDASFLQTVMNFGNSIQVYMAAQELSTYKIDDLQLNEKYYLYHIDDELDDNVYKLVQELPEPRLSLRAREDSHDPAKNLLQDTDAAQTGILADNDKKAQKPITCANEHASTVANSPIKAENEISFLVDQQLLPILTKKQIPDASSDTCLTTRLTRVSLEGSADSSEEMKTAINNQGLTVVLLCHSGNLLALDETFSLRMQISLKTRPRSICSVGNGEFAVAFQNRLLKRYFVDKHSISSFNSFAFKHHCGSISSYRSNQLVCLCLNLQPPVSNQNHVFIEIRDYRGGKIHNTFRYNYPAKTPTTVLSVYSCQLGEIIVFSDRFIEFLSEVGERRRLLEWSGVATSITGDRCGNLYIFDKTRNSISYISKDIYEVLKVTELKGLSAAAITYNAEKLNLVMLCWKSGSQ